MRGGAGVVMMTLRSGLAAPRLCAYAGLGLHGCGADRLVDCQSESYEGPCRTVQALPLDEGPDRREVVSCPFIGRLPVGAEHHSQLRMEGVQLGDGPSAECRRVVMHLLGGQEAFIGSLYHQGGVL